MTVAAEPHNLREYFHDAIQRTKAKLDLRLAEHAEFYIVNLLSECRNTDRLYLRNEGQLEDLPLALMLERAVHGPTLAERIKYFQRLGDTALFIAGYFPGRARRNLVDLDYYIRMGGGAYLSLASLYRSDDAFGQIFSELGEKFGRCVNMLTIVRNTLSAQQNKHAGLLELYEKWLATGDEQLRLLLQKEGLPTDTRIRTSQ